MTNVWYTFKRSLPSNDKKGVYIVNMIQCLQDRIKLSDEKNMPAFGLGCYKAMDAEVEKAVRSALESGYTMIDTATRYENEYSVGKAIKESGIDREKLFVVTKIWPTFYNKPEKAIEYSLKQLNIDYIDMYLLHWPGVDETARYRTWEAIQKYMQKELIQNAGVSNFKIHHLKGMYQAFGKMPAVNQIELHPWYPQQEITSFCKENDIAVEGWGPIFRGHIKEVPLMAELAEKYGKSPVQVTLRWHIQKGFIVIPKSSNPERIKQNADVFDFELTTKDMKKIDQLSCGKHFGNDSDTYTGKDFQFTI